MNSTKYFCRNCGRELKSNQKPCLFCGCNNLDIRVNFIETTKIRFNLKLRRKRKGLGKFIKEILQGWFPSIDKNKHPEGVEKMRIIDKENPNKKDSYQEKIKDVETGKITRNVKEPLCQHRH